MLFTPAAFQSCYSRTIILPYHIWGVGSAVPAKILRSTWVLIAAFALLVLLASPAGVAADDLHDVRGLGLVRSRGPFPKLDTSYLASQLKALPPAVDLSDGLPPVGNQANQSSCVGWALGYYYKTFQEREERGWDVSSAQRQFSPSWIYNQRSTYFCFIDAGMSYDDGLSIVRDKGAATLASFPYDPNDSCTQPSQAVTEAAWQYRAESFANIFPFEGTASIGTLKALLASGEPFLVGVPIYSSFYGVTYDQPVVPRPAPWETFYGGHAMCVVGYDDSIGGFRTVNSWGPEWGEGGYCYLSYDFVRYDCWEAWLMTDHLAEPVDVPLSAGWNLISLPLELRTVDIAELLAPIAVDLDVAFMWDAQSGAWERYSPSVPPFVNSLQQFDPARGMWMKVDQATVLTVHGTTWTGAGIPLSTGWNLVGFPGSSAEPVVEALSSINGKYTTVYAYRDDTSEWECYDIGVPPAENSLQQMEPMHGYWIYVIDPCLWTMTS